MDKTMEVNKNEVRERIEKVEGVRLEFENEKVIESYDEYSFPPIILKYDFDEKLEDKIKLNNSEKIINKEKLVDYLKKLNDWFFIQLREIIFVADEKDLKTAELHNGQRVCEHLKKDHLAVRVYTENTLVINVKKLKEEAKKIEEELIYSSFKQELNRAIITTLLHELGHQLLAVPLLTTKELEKIFVVDLSGYDLREGEEEIVEEFAINYFRKNRVWILK